MRGRRSSQGRSQEVFREESGGGAVKGRRRRSQEEGKEQVSRATGGRRRYLEEEDEDDARSDGEADHPPPAQRGNQEHPQHDDQHGAQHPEDLRPDKHTHTQVSMRWSPPTASANHSRHQTHRGQRQQQSSILGRDELRLQHKAARAAR